MSTTRRQAIIQALGFVASMTFGKTVGGQWGLSEPKGSTGHWIIVDDPHRELHDNRHATLKLADIDRLVDRCFHLDPPIRPIPVELAWSDGDHYIPIFRGFKLDTDEEED